MLNAEEKIRVCYVCGRTKVVHAGDVCIGCMERYVVPPSENDSQVIAMKTDIITKIVAITKKIGVVHADDDGNKTWCGLKSTDLPDESRTNTWVTCTCGPCMKKGLAQNPSYTVLRNRFIEVIGVEP